MGAHGGGDQGVAFPAADEGLDLGQKLGLHIEDHSGYESPQAHLPGCFCGRIRVVVHVTIAGYAVADLLQAAQLDPPADVLLGETGLQGPDLLLEPWHKLHVVGIAAQQGHGQMGVAVDQAGNGQLAAAVDGLLAALVFEVGPYPGDPALFYEDVPAGYKLAGVKKGDIFYQHRMEVARRGKKTVESSGLRSLGLKRPAS